VKQETRRIDLRQLRRRLVLILIVYFFAGATSQKLIPGVDEIFPFYGWSLFSKVPNQIEAYTVIIDHHEGQPLEPVDLLQAPGTIVTGNRYIARKVIQKFGQATRRGRSEQADGQRRQLESTYLQGTVEYELFFERYDALEKWRSGQIQERRSLGRFTSGDGR
jgi:hypothetical protein